MRYNMVMFCSGLLIALLIYGLVKEQTIGSICRNTGKTIRSVASLGSSMDGEEWGVISGIRRGIHGTGRALEDACSGQWG